MKLVEKIIEITGMKEEECMDDCPFNHKELAKSDTWDMYCEDCEKCLNQELK